MLTNASYGQHLAFAREQVKLLTSPGFHGRGYVMNGSEIAAKYLAAEFSKFNLKQFGNTYYQHYTFPVNTFPGDMDVAINGSALKAGEDFLIYPPSSGKKGRFTVETVDSSVFTSNFTIRNFFKKDYSHTFIVVDTLHWGRNETRRQLYDLLNLNAMKSAGIIQVTDGALIHSVSQYCLPYCSLIVKRSALALDPQRINVKIKNKEIENKAVNVIGYIPGKIDSFLVMTAHYDHLGMMGKDTFFPGANDNASGTAMLLDFARSYSEGRFQPKYTIVFMLFSGEEVGLLGSSYYTQNPLFPLTKIKMLVNLDMMGTGSEGVTVFNGSTYPKEFHKLDSLDKTMSLDIPLRSKGITKSSDHYVFHQKNVPVLFFNCSGKEVGYHIVGDKYEALPFTVYEKLYKLIDAYLKTF